MTTLSKILTRIDTYRSDMVRLQIALTAIPALSPDNGGTGEYDKAQFLITTLRGVGFNDVQRYDAPDSRVPSGVRPNIVVTIPGRKKKTVWIMTHTDIVPPGERSFWSADPYEGYEKDGRVYGRGTEDNQQDLVASLFAARAFLDERIVPEHTIRLAFVADEETGSHYGMTWLLENRPELFNSSDFYVVPDFGSSDGSKIEIAEKSLLWVRFKTIGKQCHGSRPDIGRNAFRAASYLVTELDRIRTRFDRLNPLFEPPESTFEPTRKDANVPNINTIPGEDIFCMDCRVLPDYALDDVLAEMRKTADGIENTFGVTIEISTVQAEQAPPSTHDQAEVVISLQKAIQSVYGIAATPIGIGGGTVAACLRKKRLPAAVWCRIGETAHQPDEHCLIDNMIGNAGVYGHLFCNATPDTE